MVRTRRGQCGVSVAQGDVRLGAREGYGLNAESCALKLKGEIGKRQV